MLTEKCPICGAAPIDTYYSCVDGIQEQMFHCGTRTRLCDGELDVVHRGMDCHTPTGFAMATIPALQPAIAGLEPDPDREKLLTFAGTVRALEVPELQSEAACEIRYQIDLEIVRLAARIEAMASALGE